MKTVPAHSRRAVRAPSTRANVVNSGERNADTKKASLCENGTLSVRVREIGESSPVSILLEEDGALAPDCGQIARHGTIVPELLSLIYWGARCDPHGWFVETVPINGYASAVAHRGGIRDFAPICDSASTEAAVRRTLALQGEAGLVITSLMDFKRRLAKPSIFKVGTIRSSDAEMEASLRGYEHCLAAARMIIAFCGSHSQAERLMRLARTRTLMVVAVDEDGGRMNRPLDEILAATIDCRPPIPAWLALLEPDLAQEMRLSHESSRATLRCVADAGDRPPDRQLGRATVIRTESPISHEALYRDWAAVVWRGGRVTPLDECRTFFQYFAHRGARVSVEVPLASTDAPAVVPDLYSVSWLESQRWAEQNNPDAEIWRQLEVLRTTAPIGDLIGSGGDSLVFASEGALKLCTKAWAGTSAQKIVDIANDVFAATRDMAIRGLKIQALLGETFLAYAIRCEVCAPFDSAGLRASDILDFLDACLALGVFCADVSASNFRIDVAGQLVFVDQSDYLAYAPVLWPVFIDRMRATTGLAIAATDPPASAELARRQLQACREALKSDYP
jgi:hypothetical protein